MIKFTCNKPQLSFSATFDSQLQFEDNYSETGIKINGKCPEHVNPNYVEHSESIIWGDKGMEFDAQLRLLFTDGKVEKSRDALNISSASLAVFDTT